MEKLKKIKVKVEKSETIKVIKCPRCNGKGELPNDSSSHPKYYQCPVCNGAGKLQLDED